MRGFGKREKPQVEYVETAMQYALVRLPNSTEWEGFARDLEEKLNDTNAGICTVSRLAFTNDDGQPMLEFQCKINATDMPPGFNETIGDVMQHSFVEVIKLVMPNMLLHHQD